MTADQLRKHVTAVPFSPFHIRTADGRRIPVLNRDFILITPTQTHTLVFQADGSHLILDIVSIPAVEYGPPTQETNASALNP